MHLAHNHHEHHHHHDGSELDFGIYSSEVKRILKIILVLNVLVALIKFFIGFQAVSLSIIGDAVHSTIDSLNNVIGLVAIRFASEPADAKHHYGHAKFEALGALGVVIFLAIACFELVEKSIIRMLNPSDYPQIDSLTINLLLVTLVINFGVWFYESRMATKLGSYLLKADAAHTFSDILVTISILASLFFISHGCLWLDPILGLLIALLIFKSAFEILKGTIPMLVDEAWLQPNDVKDLVLDVSKVIGFENFKSRRNHKDFFIEMTVSFDTDSLTEAHNLSHQISSDIKAKFGEQVQVIIHLEPK